MTLREFKETHPNAKGNLCYNCRNLCSDEECALAKKRTYCSEFSYIQDKCTDEGNINSLIKAFERDYYDSLDQANYYFNRLACGK